MEIRSSSQNGESNSESVDRLLERGLTVYSEGRIEEAIKIWNQVLAQEPNNQIAQEYINTAKSDLFEAQKSDETAGPAGDEEEVFYDPETTSDQFGGGAPDQFAKIPGLEEGENDIEYLLGTADEFELKGDLVSAHATYEKIVALDPTNTRASNRLAKIGEQLESVAEPSHFIERGYAFFKEKKYEKAISEWRKALEVKPDDQGLIKNIEQAKSALEAAPFIANCTRKGQEFFEQGEYKSAVSEWKKILAIEPDNQEILENIKMTEMLIQKAPKESNKMSEGKALMESGDYRGAVAIFEDILNDDPDNEQVIQLYLRVKTQIETPPADDLDLDKELDLDKDLELEEDSPGEIEGLSQADEAMITRTTDYEEQEEADSAWQPSATPATDTIAESSTTYAPEYELPKRVEKFPLKMVVLPIVIVGAIIGALYLVYSWKNSSGTSTSNQPSTNVELLQLATKYYNEGIAAMEKENYEEALQFFRQAIDVNPNHAEAKAKYKETELILDPSKLPDDQKAAKISEMLTIAAQFEKQKKYKDAMESYQYILKIDHNNEISMKKFQELKGVLREIEKQELFKAPVLVQLKKAKEYKAVTYYEDARDLLKNILRVDPGNREARDLLRETEEQIQADAKRKARAEEMYDMGMRLFKEEKYGQAIAQWRNVLRFDPTFRKAEESIKEADMLRRKKEEIRELFRGGEFYYDIGKYDAALEKFERLLELDPDHEDAKFYVAKIKEYKALGTFNH